MQEAQQIYQRYSGKAVSDRLTVFKDNETYIFLYQKFKRSNPSQSERKLGFKPKRIMTHEKQYSLSQLESVDFKLYPFEHLLENFYIQENLPQRSC